MSSNQDNIDIIALRKLYRENTAAKAAFEHFASCRNNKKVTTLERLNKILNGNREAISQNEVRSFLKQLERLNCGEYKVGRRGHPSRFLWNVGLVSLGQVACGQTSNVDSFSEDLQDDEKDNEEAHNQPEMMRESYRLRPDLRISLELPKDLTPTEASRLSRFITSLPFEGPAETA